MKRTVNKDVKDSPVMRMMYNPQYKGLERDRDTRPLEEVLKGFKCINEQNNFMVFARDDLGEDSTNAEVKAYVHIFSLNQEYLVGMREYLTASDRLGNKHYNYYQSLVLFMEKYGYRLFLFSIVCKEQKVFE